MNKKASKIPVLSFKIQHLILKIESCGRNIHRTFEPVADRSISLTFLNGWWSHGRRRGGMVAAPGSGRLGSGCLAAPRRVSCGLTAAPLLLLEYLRGLLKQEEMES